MDRKLLFAMLAALLLAFLVSAGVLQWMSGLPPQRSGGVVDQFNGLIFWAASITALMIATARVQPLWKLFFWLLVCAGLAALAIDEVFEFHEQTQFQVGDDDFIKFVFWIIACAGVYLIYRLIAPSRAAMTALTVGLAFTTLWLISDLGDGDLFTLPIPLQTLQWIEEYMEMLATASYLTGLLFHYQDELFAAAGEHRPSSPAGGGVEAGRW
jgi:hypothetical protein